MEIKKITVPSKELVIADPCYIGNALERLNDKKNYTHNLLDYGVFIPIDKEVNEVSIIKNEIEGTVKNIIIEYNKTDEKNLLEIEAGTFIVDSGKVVIIDVEKLKSKWITEEDGHIHRIRLVGDDSEKVFEFLKEQFNFIENNVDNKGRKEYVWEIGNNPYLYELFKKEESLLKDKFDKFYRKELEIKLLNDLSRYEKMMIEEKLSKGNYLYYLTEFPFNSEKFVNTEGLFSINKELDMDAYGTLSGYGDGYYSVFNYYDNKNKLVKTIIQF